MESNISRQDIKLDDETVKAAATAAREERVDAALAELARGGDQAAAAEAGGFTEPFVPPVEPIYVPGWLSVAPPAIGAISILLFVLNSFGIFGEGPDLDALAAQLSS